MMEKYIFYFFSFITIIAALYAVFTQHIARAVFSLFAVFLGVAGLFFLAGAEFLGMTHILVYVGGILVIMLFGLMLSNRHWISIAVPLKISFQQLISLVATGGLFIFLLKIIYSENWEQLHWAKDAALQKNNYTDPLNFLGIELMSNYLLPFELISVILLIALIGAAYLARASKNMSHDD